MRCCHVALRNDLRQPIRFPENGDETSGIPATKVRHMGETSSGSFSKHACRDGVGHNGFDGCRPCYVTSKCRHAAALKVALATPTSPSTSLTKKKRA